MSENNFYALARALQETEGLEKNLSQVLLTLRESVEKDYLQKIHLAADSEKTFAIEHPPREVTLLRALSAYADERGKTQIDRISQSLLFLHSLQHIQQRVQTFSAENLLETRSIEGQPPEFSERSARMAGLLLTLALAEQFYV